MADIVDDVGITGAQIGPTIHYGGEPWKPLTACGEKITRATIYQTTWAKNIPVPVSCRECLKHAPKRKMIPTWQNRGKRAR